MAGEELKPCPLCRSPHTRLTRNIHGEVERVFCKVCDCSAPIAAWNRCPSPSLAGEYERGFLACREAAVKVSDERLKMSVDGIESIVAGWISDDIASLTPTGDNMSATSIGQIINALYRDPDRTVATARIDLAYTEAETTIEIGPHPGFSNGSMVVVLSDGAGDHKSMYELEFKKHADVCEARALAAALNAWADWADEENKKKDENQ